MAKAKKLPSENWRVQAYMRKDENGKSIMKSFTAPTKKEAEAQAAMYTVQQKATQRQRNRPVFRTVLLCCVHRVFRKYPQIFSTFLCKYAK